MSSPGFTVSREWGWRWWPRCVSGGNSAAGGIALELVVVAVGRGGGDRSGGGRRIGVGVGGGDGVGCVGGVGGIGIVEGVMRW